MKILYLSAKGDSFPLGCEMMKEGHEVKFYTKSPKDKDAGTGFVPLVDNYVDHLKWADLVITDDTIWGKINDSIRKMGIPVIGGTPVTDKLEEDRQAGQEMFKALDMQTLDSKDFTDMDEAIAYIEENPRKFVVKVSGKAQDDKTLTYVGQMEDGSDVPKVLEHYRSKMGSGIASVQVQDVAEGVEVALGGWFNGSEFLDPLLLNFEHKKLMPCRYEQAGIGPATGEMGTIGCWKDKGFELYEETLAKFIPVLKKEGYHGYFDINCIVHPYIGLEPNTPFHIHPLEMTNRFGWPTILMQMEAMKIQDLGELFLGIANGTATDYKVDGYYCACVVIGCPPLPYISKEIADKMSNGLPIMFKDGDCEGVYPGDAILKGEDWICQGEKGYPCVATGCGDTIQDAQAKAYARVRNIIIPNAMYREDVGDLIPGKLMQIQRLLEHNKIMAETIS